MKILLIHQYFLGKNRGGGARFNEMAKTWSDEGHEVTVLAGSWPDVSGKKNPNYEGKYVFHEKDFYKNIDVFRCHVSPAYNVNFIGRLLGLFYICIFKYLGWFV